MSEVKNLVRRVEDKIGSRLSEAVDSLGNLIKDQAKRLKQYSDRLVDLEHVAFTGGDSSKAKSRSGSR
jgi:hypothetical protein